MEKKIDDIIVMEKKEPYSLERDFMDDILSKIRVDAVPNAYLYALYCYWMEEKYPGLKRLILGKNSFLEEVRRLIVFFRNGMFPITNSGYWIIWTKWKKHCFCLDSKNGCRIHIPQIRMLNSD